MSNRREYLILDVSIKHTSTNNLEIELILLQAQSTFLGSKNLVTSLNNSEHGRNGGGSIIWK